MSEQNTIYLIGYDLNETELYDAWCEVAYTKAELFFVKDEYRYTMLGDRVLYVSPTYLISGSELEHARQVYRDALDAIRTEYDPDWTDLETALFFHDYLCMRYSYDESLTRYTAYEMLTEGTGVCQAYALIYADLLNDFGIECGYVVSREMNHAWNVVTIDGEKYNVDVTYDDPVANIPVVKHN